MMIILLNPTRGIGNANIGGSIYNIVNIKRWYGGVFS